jgi:spermidine synthase
MKLTFDIPEAINGNFEIKKITSDNISNKNEPLDTYTVLYKDNQGIMQDTTHEYIEHQPLWDNATGDVLIAGLGIGFVNQKLIDNKNVTSVTIIEKHKEVIDMVWSHCPKDDSIILIHDDIITWNPIRKYNVGWFDTWLTECGDYSNYNKILYNKYEKYCEWIGFWTSV